MFLYLQWLRKQFQSAFEFLWNCIHPVKQHGSFTDKYMEELSLKIVTFH